MKIRYVSIITLFIFSGLLLNSCVTPKPLGSPSRTEVIDKYFTGRDLDQIEGIWVWDNNLFELAIINNSFDIYPQYDYIAIITDTLRRGWEIGEIKFLLKKTTAGDTYIVSYFADKALKKQFGTNLIMQSTNKALLDKKTLMLRLYPELKELKEPTHGSTDSDKQPPSKYDDFLDCVVVVRSSSGMGSGFYITADGHIISNNHVVGRDRTVSIKMRSGRTTLGEVISTDKDRDLALIKVQGDNYSWLPLGTLADAGIGTEVFAIGTPIRLEWSVSRGIVSAIRKDKNDITWVQTDAAINSGNSGGPLIDTKTGHVVGVNTWGYEFGYDEAYEGLNFAVSAEEIRKTFPQIQQ